MSIVHSQHRITIQKNKNSIHRGMALSLLILLATLLPIKKATANPNNKLVDSTIQQEDRTRTFGEKGEKRWYVFSPSLWLSWSRTI